MTEIINSRRAEIDRKGEDMGRLMAPRTLVEALKLGVQDQARATGDTAAFYTGFWRGVGHVARARGRA